LLRPAVFPNNLQFCNHFAEFLFHGYRSALGSVEVRFPKRDGSRLIGQQTVGISDGQTKVLIMASIVGMVLELELEEHEDLKSGQLGKTLASFAAIRCSFTHYDNPRDHFSGTPKWGPDEGGPHVAWGGSFFQWQKLAKIGNKWQQHVELFVKTTCCLTRIS